jgi:hypothetical protein
MSPTGNPTPGSRRLHAAIVPPARAPGGAPDDALSELDQSGMGAETYGAATPHRHGWIWRRRKGGWASGPACSEFEMCSRSAPTEARSWRDRRAR